MEQQKQKVLIYAGTGAGKDSVFQTLSTLKKNLGAKYEVRTVLALELIEQDWENETALLVVPGGADIPYTYLLNGKGNAKIKAYVENGGAFLGICAGAYYGSSQVEFAVGSSLEVVGPRELGFFQGVSEGPALAPYHYKNHSGARAACLQLGAVSFSPVVFYSGGGAFVDAAAYSNVQVIANYNHEICQQAAIVKCLVGKGVALLSAVHFEFDPALMDEQDTYLKLLIPELQKSEEQRVLLVHFLFQQLGL